MAGWQEIIQPGLNALEALDPDGPRFRSLVDHEIYKMEKLAAGGEARDDKDTPEKRREDLKTELHEELGRLLAQAPKNRNWKAALFLLDHPTARAPDHQRPKCI